MWRIPLRVLGVLITGYALFLAFVLSNLRLDTAGEVQEVIRADAKVGLVFAVGLFLLGVPRRREQTLGWVCLVPAAVLAGGLLAGGLASSHYWQQHIRSTPPVG